MSIEIVIGLVSIGVTVIFYLVDKFLNASTRSAKKYLLKKWCENKKINLKLQNTIFDFATKYNGWNSLAFTDADVTYQVYYDNLKQKYEQEYSDVAFYTLKKLKLSKFELTEYIAKLKVQEDNLYLLQNSLDLAIKKFEKGNQSIYNDPDVPFVC